MTIKSGCTVFIRVCMYVCVHTYACIVCVSCVCVHACVHPSITFSGLCIVPYT